MRATNDNIALEVGALGALIATLANSANTVVEIKFKLIYCIRLLR